jgi:hypothetical protein
MADRGDTFLREVDEEVRREQLKRIWDRYGILIVGLVILLLAGIGGYRYWNHRQATLAETTGQRFEAAALLATEGKADEAAKAFAAIAADSSGGYRTLARLRVASNLAASGKRSEAAAEYEAIARDAATDPLLAEFSTLQSAVLRSDSADWTDLQNRLSPLLSGSSPWRGAAREAVALAAMRAGNTAEARKQLELVLGDRMAPASTLDRAQLLLTVLTDREAEKSGASQAPAATQGGTAGESGTAPATSTGQSSTPATKN